MRNAFLYNSLLYSESNCSKYAITLFFFFLSSAVGHCQTFISGNINDIHGDPLGGAMVSISTDSVGSILAFGISETNGQFLVELNSEDDSLFVKISHLGYRAWTYRTDNHNQQLEVELEETSEELKEVVVDAKVIQKRGDTLSFRVSAFKGQKDRVIADVLKKMPGIEVLPGGQILYQGEPIQKYYIEGMDLLEGRYSLANNNISAEDVSEVQILENHQPVKVLDSLEFSNQASLNIRLKKDVTMSGSAEVGTGLAPLLWGTGVTPMLFTKKQQAIFSYQSNNTGSDVSSEIQDFSFSGFDQDEYTIDKKDWLAIVPLSPPPFVQERWLDNNVHLGSANYLIRMQKDLDLKVNISYLNDFQQQLGNTKTRFFTLTDTIDFEENIYNELFTNMLQTKFVLERNRTNDYLKNELEIIGFRDSERGKVETRDMLIRQRLSSPFSGIKNKLKVLQPVGKQLITFRSNTGYTEARENLNANPGQFSELLNEGEPYAETEQILTSSTFFTENSGGFTQGLSGLSMAPEMGFSVGKQQISSRIGVLEGGNRAYLEGGYRNNLNFFSSRIFIRSRFSYQKNDWEIRLTTPVNYRHFDIEDAYLGEVQNISKLTFEPLLFLKKKISANWESSFSGKLSNSYGDFRSMYSGYILSNFRSIQRFDSPFPESFKQSYAGRLSYRNPLKSIFANMSYSYNLTQYNLLYSSIIDENGAIRLEPVEQDNHSVSHNWTFEASKYFRKIQTTLDLGSSFSQNLREQYLNNALAMINFRNTSLNIALETDVTDWLSTSYGARLSFIQSGTENKSFAEVRNQQHMMEFSFFPADNQYFDLDLEYYNNKGFQGNRSDYFLNLGYQYTFEKRKMDLKATWNNILDYDEFINITNRESYYIENTYRLRPSQLKISLKFTF